MSETATPMKQTSRHHFLGDYRRHLFATVRGLVGAPSPAPASVAQDALGRCAAAGVEPYLGEREETLAEAHQLAEQMVRELLGPWPLPSDRAARQVAAIMDQAVADASDATELVHLIERSGLSGYTAMQAFGEALRHRMDCDNKRVQRLRDGE